MPQTQAYAAHTAGAPLAPFSFTRREPGQNEVEIDILYCGVCHSDIHQARDEWGGSIFPMVPGHEIIGKISKVGANVTTYKVGDLAGVGCMVDSCRTCGSCVAHLEQFCEAGTTYTYNGRNRQSGEPTYGGYASHIVLDQAFTLKVPQNLDPARAAPLLCAGITTYSPLRAWGIGKGHKVGIVGLGGLGHMGVKLARAFGAKVTVFTTSATKVEDARRLGAHEVIVSSAPDAFKGHARSFDFILNTVSAPHDLDGLLGLLKNDGTMCLVGVPAKAPQIKPINLIFGRRRLAGSLIGGIKETQEMLDFCAKHEVLCDIEIIPVQKINEAYERMLKSDVKYRFVIDMKSLAKK